MRSKKKNRLLLLAFAGTALLYANQPSFDCSKVKKESCESIICSSDELMALDREMANAYRQAKTRAKKPDQLKAMQRGWIKGRNECWKEEDKVSYMADLYRQRIAELEGSSDKADTAASANGFRKELSLKGLRFAIEEKGEGSLREAVITVSGLAGGKKTILKNEIDGLIVSTDTADLNDDGFPELYIFAVSAGSGSYGSVIAYASNHNKSITPIHMPELDYKSKEAKGYMGHDRFSVQDAYLIRSFPVYKNDDPNCCPTGGTRTLYYRLIPGEAGWQFKLVKNSEKQ